MRIEEKSVPLIIIDNLEKLDPIRVLIEEKQEKSGNEIYYTGRILILCYGVALNHYWGSMGMPLKEFFIKASTGYIADKFKMNARETYRPDAYSAYRDEETGEIVKDEENGVHLDMAKHHYDYICRIIESVKECFERQLKQIDFEKVEV